MLKIKNLLRQTATGMLVSLLVVFYPLGAYAQTTDPAVEDSAASSQQASESTTAQPSDSTTASSSSSAAPDEYVYNSETGKWENDNYTWDPATGQTAPKNQQDYSYNPSTGQWDTTEYYYDPATGRYEPNNVSAAQATNDTQAASADEAGYSGEIANTGPDSTNTIDNNSTNNGIFDLFYNTNISNNINSTATSGNASILHNTAGGSALSGNADAMANILNLLHSSWDPNIAQFNASIVGDIYGDLFFDPTQLVSGTGPNSSNTINNSATNNLDVNLIADTTINNNVNLTALSGDSTVADNTSAGDATTGSANAVANVINMINSLITAGDSFYGTVNIYGDLDGDILLPPNLLELLIADTGPDSSNLITNDTTTNLNLSLTTNNAINNNIDLNATTGSAEVSGNTIGGNATTGEATTNLNIFNLTGSNVVGKNAMLVFVNVLGDWVGLIMNAPTGSSSALLTGPGSTNTINNSTDTNLDFDATFNNTINNNINVNSGSGDALVSGNTSAGNATSGDATASANIFNLVDSQMEFDDWFGVLFINIFGNWNGSFGVNTAAGNKTNPTTTSGGSGGAGSPSQNNTAAASPRGFMGFVPRVFGATGYDNSDSSAATVTSQTATNTFPTPPSDALSTASQETIPEVVTNSAKAAAGRNWLPPLIAIMLGVALLGGERLLALFRGRP
jgi:hypothetical protein